MTTTALLIIGIVALVLLGAALAFAASRRRDAQSAMSVSSETRRRDAARVSTSVGAATEQTPTGREVERAAALARREGDLVPVMEDEIAPWVPPDPETIGVARRQFLNRAIIAMFGFSLSGFGAAVIAQLYPGESEGFGADIKIGEVNDAVSQIRANGGFLYRPEGRMWLTEYPAGALDKAEPIYGASTAWPGIQAGFKALYQKCPHLGCRVPDCGSSQFFECPCHGSFYNQVGEKRGGPAPRGMDFFGMRVENNVLTVMTGDINTGPAIGTNTTGQEREGPSCLGATSH